MATALVIVTSRHNGLSPVLANKYSLTLAVKAMTQNSAIDKAKLIMQAGTFNNMNDAISKFVNSGTEATGQANSVLYFRHEQFGNNRGNRGKGNNHNNGYRNYNNYNRGNFRGSSRGYNRERNNSNRGNKQSNNSNGNDRITQGGMATALVIVTSRHNGLSPVLANKYSLTLAVKAMTQNSAIDKAKLIMQAGTFNNMNDAISKFVNSGTEATGQANSVLYFRHEQFGNNRGNRGKGNNHNNGYRNYNNYNRGNFRGSSRGYNRERNNSNRGNKQSNNSNGNDRITQ
ncbi:uncharacterized protein DDB_G0283357-like, partial [Drosophila montana]|uniref:uncharacterized protein DDB_G0283357-like n=1 Tax=Drosophila montana TaxID=40370 RepID=UPI00313F2FE3